MWSGLAVDIDGATELVEDAEERAVARVVLPAVDDGSLDPECSFLEAFECVFGEGGFADAGWASDDDWVGLVAGS